MGVIRYTAKRNVIGTHTVGLQYDIETQFQQSDEWSQEQGQERTALGGDYEYSLDRIDDLVALTSDIFLEADKPLWKEFGTSVAAREQFQIALTGTIASPGTFLDCKMHQSGRFRPVREQNGVQIYKFSFTVRLL